jgi:hypothetical protein
VGNDFAALPFKLKFLKIRDLSSFKEMIIAHKEKTRSLKSLFLAQGTYYMMNYFVGLLRYKMCFDWKRICNNYTTVLSVVPGPKQGWGFEGIKVRQVFYVVPGAGALGCGIGVITHDDYC